jgi:SLT domain-containing protein
MPGLGGAAMGLGLLGATGALAFGGVAKAVSAAHQAATNIGETQQQLAATEFSNSVAIRQAQQALGAAHMQAAQDAQQAAMQISQSQMSLAGTERNAASSMIAAQQAVGQAEHSLADAQYTEQQAQVSLTEARIQARIQLQQLQDQVKDAALSEQSASLAVQQAKYQQTLTDQNAYSTSLDRQQAALAVAQAEQQLTEAQQNKANVTQEASAKDRKYFDGQQQVIQAEHALKDAVYGVTLAQQQLADSQRNLRDTMLNNAAAVKEAQMAVKAAEENAAFTAQRDALAVRQAQQNVTDTIREQKLAYQATMASANQSALQYAKDMARLTPAGRQMVREILGLRSAFHGMISAAQAAVAPGIDVFLRGMKSLAPDVTRGVRLMGDAISHAFGLFGRQMDTKSFREVLNGLIRNGIQFANTVLPAVAQFIQELARIGGQKGAASGLANLLAGLVRGFTGLARVIGQNEGPINQILTLIGKVLTQAGPALGTLIGTFAKVLSPVTRFLNSPGGKPFVKILGDIVGGFLAWKVATKLVIGPMGSLFDGLGKVSKIVKDLPGNIGDLADKISGLPGKIAGVPGKIGGYFKSIGSAIGNVGSAVGGLAKSMWSGLSSAASSVASFVSGMASKLAQATVATGTWIAEHTVATATFIAENAAQAASATAAFIAENAATLGIAAAIAGLVAAAIYLGTHWKQVWGDIKDIALDVWHNVLDPAFHGIGSLAQWLYGNAIKPNLTLIGDAIHDLGSVANWLWQNVFSPVFHAIEAGARDFVSGFETIWHRLESVFKTPVNFLIGTVYDKGIARLWNDVVTHIGLGSIRLPVIPTMAGGGVLPGYAPGRDTVPALLSPGEGVLTPQATRGLGGEQGIGAINQHFGSSSSQGGGGGVGHSLAKMPIKEIGRRLTERPALHAATFGKFASGGVAGSRPSGGGGLLGSIGGFLSGVGHDILSGISGAVDVAKIVAAVATGNTTAFINAASKLIGTHAAGDLAKMMIGVPKTLVADAAKQLVSMFSSSSGGGVSSPGHVTGTVAQWFAKAVNLTGVGAGWIPDLETIAHYESGDNPDAINLSDSNAAAGDPSRGIMQTIMATFLAYHQPGTSMNIYDPVANIAAAIRYIKARYGTVADVPGIVSLAHGGGYVGYDSGGWLMPTGLMPGPVNSTGQPEAVLTPAESQAFVAIVKRLTAQGPAGAGATVIQQFNGTQWPNAEQQAAMKREMALALAGP